MQASVDDVGLKIEKAICSSEGSFKNKDGLNIFTREWKSKTQESPKALIFIVHGFSEHSDWTRYTSFLAPALVEKVGHGKSDGERVQISTFDIFVRDLLDHIDTLTSNYAGIPWFLLGLSMGAVIAILAAMQRPKFFTGLVLCAPPLIIDPAKDNACMRFLGKLVTYIMPSLQIIPPIDPSRTCRNHEQIKEYEADPLTWRGGIKAAWGLAMAAAIDKIQEEMECIEWPFLLLQGTADILSMYQGAVEFEKKVRSQDKTLKMYEGYYHDLLNEPGNDALIVLNDILQWLKKRMPAE